MDIIQGQFSAGASRPSEMGRFYTGPDPRSYPTQIMTTNNGVEDEFYFVESEDQFQRWLAGQNPGLSFNNRGEGFNSGGGGRSMPSQGGGGPAPAPRRDDVFAPTTSYTSLSDHLRDRAAMGTTLAAGPVRGQFATPGSEPFQGFGAQRPLDERALQGPMPNRSAADVPTIRMEIPDFAPPARAMNPSYLMGAERGMPSGPMRGMWSEPGYNPYSTSPDLWREPQFGPRLSR